MGRGSGNIGRTNKVEAPTPATVTGADNGLSLVGTIVELGGSMLLHSTAIDIDTFDFTIRDNALVYLEFEPATSQAIIGDQANDAVLLVDMLNGTTSMGDPFNNGNNTELVINDANETVTISSGANAMLLLDQANNLYQIGDITGASLNSFFQIDDAAQEFTTRSGGVISGLEIFATINPIVTLGDIAGLGNGTTFQLNDSAESFLMRTTAAQFLALNVIADQFSMGDIAGAGNQTTLIISDNAQQAGIYTLGTSMLNLDNINGIFQLGGGGVAINGITFEMDDAAQTFTTQSGGVVQGLLVFAGTQPIVRLGDIAGIGNTVEFQVDDSAQFIQAVRSFTPQGFSIDMANIIVNLGDIAAVNSRTTLVIDDTSSTILMNTAVNTITVTIGATGRAITTSGDTTLMATTTALADGAGVGAGTLLNAPAAGDPTKWIPIDDNGTVRHIPAW